jgi:hypothetical protein
MTDKSAGTPRLMYLEQLDTVSPKLDMFTIDQDP